MKVKVINTSGAETGKEVTLPQDIFGVEPNDHAIYLDVKQYLANQRQGTHKAKERAEVAGSTRKIKKQKGTGTARAGSAKNPLFKGGGTVFGPRPRSYSFKLNKNLKKQIMNNITLAILFFLAMVTSTYFFGKLMTWMVSSIAPESRKKEFTSKDITVANIVMFVSITLWTIIFYTLISR